MRSMPLPLVAFLPDDTAVSINCGESVRAVFVRPPPSRLQRRLSVHKKDVVGYADAVLAAMSVDGSPQ